MYKIKKKIFSSKKYFQLTSWLFLFMKFSATKRKDKTKFK